MSRPPSPPRRQRACAQCAKARARCSFRPENIERHLCDRCLRLGNECERQASAPLRKPKRIRNNNNAVPNNTASALPMRPLQQSHVPPATLSPAGSEEAESEDGPDEPLGMPYAQADHVLKLFRDLYLPHFPCIQIPPDMTCQELYSLRPLTAECILAVAAPLPIPELMVRIKNVLAELLVRVMGLGDRLDVLQGLLMLLHWTDFEGLCSGEFTKLAHLALGSAHTFGLTRPSESQPLDEQRVLLGLYNLLAIDSAHFSRVNPLAPSLIASVVAKLSSSLEPSDGILSTTTSLTLQSASLPTAQTTQEPYLFLVEGGARGFRPALDGILDGAVQANPGFPSAALVTKRFNLHREYLVVRLHEPAMHLSRILSHGGHAGSHRSLCLRNALFACKTYLDQLLEMPPEELAHGGMPLLQRTNFVAGVAARLLLDDAEDWDASMARLTIDLGPMLDTLSGMLEGCEETRLRREGSFCKEFGIEVGDHDGECSQMYTLAIKTRALASWFRQKVDAGDYKEGDPIPTWGTWPGVSNKSSAPGENVSPEPVRVEAKENERQGRGVWRGAFKTVPFFNGMYHNTAWDFDDVEDLGGQRSQTADDGETE